MAYLGDPGLDLPVSTGFVVPLAGKQKFLLHVSLIPEQSRTTTVIFSGELSGQGIANAISDLPG